MYVYSDFSFLFEMLKAGKRTDFRKLIKVESRLAKRYTGPYSSTDLYVFSVELKLCTCTHTCTGGLVHQKVWIMITITLL